MTTPVIKPRRVGIIGAGHVGSHVAFALATQGLVDELCIADCDAAKAAAQAMDIEDAASYLPHHVRVEACAVDAFHTCDIIILCAGPSPVANESRLDELPRTMEILDDVVPRLRQLRGFVGILLCITNPADVVAAYMQETLALPAERVICTGTCLDSARLHALLGARLRVAHRSLNSAYVLGEHGDSSIVAWSHVCVGGKPLVELQQENNARFPALDREQFQRDVRERGFVLLRSKGSTEFGIASSAAEIVRAIFHNESKVIPCSVRLNGQYGECDVYASTPAIIGAAGVEQVLELRLSEEELAGFKHSCGIIREHIKRAKQIKEKKESEL